jgi:hypothetical protein
MSAIEILRQLRQLADFSTKLLSFWILLGEPRDLKFLATDENGSTIKREGGAARRS